MLVLWALDSQSKGEGEGVKGKLNGGITCEWTWHQSPQVRTGGDDARIPAWGWSPNGARPSAASPASGRSSEPGVSKQLKGGFQA